VTTITAHALGLPGYDPAVLHGATLRVEEVLAACADLIEMPKAERAALPYMHPGRVDVIGAGALIWRRVVQRVAEVAPLSTVVTSEHDILDGICWSLVQTPTGE
jgi:exopolyphosphatase/guanosine-5'-triphosphate,3'-diphosphate pyrophosphatase